MGFAATYILSNIIISNLGSPTEKCIDSRLKVDRREDKKITIKHES